MIKKIGAWLGGIVALLSLLTTAMGVFVLERENDDLYREVSKLEAKMNSLEDDFQDKEIACSTLNAELKATFKSGRYYYDWCKKR